VCGAHFLSPAAPASSTKPPSQSIACARLLVGDVRIQSWCGCIAAVTCVVSLVSSGKRCSDNSSPNEISAKKQQSSAHLSWRGNQCVKHGVGGPPTVTVTFETAVFSCYAVQMKKIYKTAKG